MSGFMVISYKMLCFEDEWMVVDSLASIGQRVVFLAPEWLSHRYRLQRYTCSSPPECDNCTGLNWCSVEAWMQNYGVNGYEWFYGYKL